MHARAYSKYLRRNKDINLFIIKNIFLLFQYNFFLFID